VENACPRKELIIERQRSSPGETNAFLSAGLNLSRVEKSLVEGSIFSIATGSTLTATPSGLPEIEPLLAYCGFSTPTAG
jgi:hypothetical protein